MNKGVLHQEIKTTKKNQTEILKLRTQQNEESSMSLGNGTDRGEKN